MITPGQAPLDALRAVMAGEALELPPGWEGPMRASCDALAARLAAGDTMYGVNTGFGKLASTRISDPDLVQLQLNLIRSHAAGVGEPLPDAVVRLVLALKALSLARGASAAQPSTVEALLALLNGNVLPVIPARGSVGASGDLAPLAHLSLVLIGEGQAMELGATVPGAVALKRLGLKPLALGPKEGLALLNGTQVSTALALAGHFAAEDLWRTALVSGALSTEGARGSDTPFDPRIH
ncbi:MAG: aromatic amino acid lyase, partial [Roseomonas mucosa]|nr:aromatic amino acid lyase [Roseomonas mucosa]